MSPRMYGLIWLAAVVVGMILWIGGVFSLFLGVVFGFIAFGLVFVGMMCVLPGNVSHPHVIHTQKETTTVRPEGKGAVIPTYRSA